MGCRHQVGYVVSDIPHPLNRDEYVEEQHPRVPTPPYKATGYPRDHSMFPSLGFSSCLT